MICRNLLLTFGNPTNSSSPRTVLEVLEMHQGHWDRSCRTSFSTTMLHLKNQGETNQPTDRSYYFCLYLVAGRTEWSQLLAFDDSNLRLGHLRDALSDSVRALGCTSSAAFNMLELTFQAQLDPNVDLAIAWAMEPCCSVLHICSYRKA